MVWTEALRWPRDCKKFRTAFSTTVDFINKLDCSAGVPPADRRASRPPLRGREAPATAGKMPALQVAPCLRPRMMFLVHTLQSIQRQMRVYLGSRNIGVAQDDLHGAQIGAVFDHVRGTTMPQHVRAGIASGAHRGRANHLPDPLP